MPAPTPTPLRAARPIRPSPGLRPLLLALLLSSAPPLLAGPVAFDQNGNGICDIWEALYPGAALDPQADPDGDLIPNWMEALAGTDPFDPSCRFAVVSLLPEGAGLRVRWRSLPGKLYRMVGRPDLQPGPWEPQTEFRLADGEWMEELLPLDGLTPSHRFLRAEVMDADSDGDGIPDWAELRLTGFDPLHPQSAISGKDDGETLSGLFGDGVPAVTIHALQPTATEREGLEGVLRVQRRGGLAPFAVRLSVSGDAHDPQAEPAASGSYTLMDAKGNPMGGIIQMGFGQAAAEVRVGAAGNDRAETPRWLTLSILPDPSYLLGEESSATISLTDAANIPENERLLVAYLTPLPGTASPATGLSTLRLRGDNALALVNLSFSGLTTVQATATLDLMDGLVGTYAKGLPVGQVQDHPWAIRAAGFLGTHQEMLEALLSGQVAATVQSNQFLEGEIRGRFQVASGSMEPPPPETPPPVSILSGEALRGDVARFLTQSTFGPTEEEIEALAQQIETTHEGDRIAGYRAWMADQFSLGQTLHEAYTLAADTQEWALRETNPIDYTSATGNPGSANRRRAWWTIAVGGRDQLRQRVAFALSQIFVISDKDSQVSNAHYGAARFYDQLGAHADRNFRELLETVSLSPMMGTYLSHLKNQKATYHPTTGEVLVSPDENYAREIMQLFSIGLVEIHPDGSLKLGPDGSPRPTYTNQDITELARVFTGWSFSKRHGSRALGYPVEDNPSFTQSAGQRFFQASWQHPMKSFPAFQDNGSKTVLGTVIPAGLDGPSNLAAALDILFQHPNVPPFICRLLIQRLVTSTPSAGYIRRVAERFMDDGTGQRGNLRAVIEAILLDPEARDPSAGERPGFGKQKEPIVRYLQLLRALGASSQLPLVDLVPYGLPVEQVERYRPGATRMRYPTTDTAFGQTPLSAPTVFNWFLPSYSPGGAITMAGLVAPEMQETNENQVIRAINYSRTLVNSASQGVDNLLLHDTSLDNVAVSRTPWETYYQGLTGSGLSSRQAATALLDRLDRLLMAGNLRARYGTAPAPNPRESMIEAIDRSSSVGDKVVNALFLAATCPEFLHQK